MTARIFWISIVGFLLGVFIQSFLSLGWATIGFLTLIAIAVFLAALLNEQRRIGTIVLVALCACALGIARMESAMLSSDPALDAHIGSKVTIEGTVFEEPDERENSTRLSVRVETGGKALVVAPLHTNLSYGDRVRAEGDLRIPKGFETAGGREFNYAAYLAKDGIGYELVFAHIEKIGEATKNPLKSGAIWVKQKYLEGLALALPEPHAGLAGGITAGDKRALGGELSNVFRTVGLIHIVVLSGYNIMVVIGFIEWLFRRAHRYVRFSLGIGVAIFFALMTGLASSSVRAASMAVIAIAGKATGRLYLASRALAVVAFGMVLWNPWILAFDPGFQLSVIATWGLISFSPFVAARLTFVTEKLGLREIAATTIGTQLAVLPLLLYQTGRLSLVALPANLLALIVVPYAMLASFIAGVGGVIFGPLAPIAGFPAYALLSYILFVAEWGARVPFATASIGAFSALFIIFTYGAVSMYVLYRGKREMSAV